MPVRAFDESALGGVASHQVGFRVQAFEVAADRARLGEAATVVELEHRHATERVEGPEFRCAQVAAIEVVRATLEAVDASPRPEGEWGPARDLVGDDLLARLLKVSNSSLRRYAGGDRRTPDDVAWRLHVVARLLASLVGSYNEYGIRRWFERSRRALDGATPADVLEQAPSEDDERLQHVLGLADELTGAAAAA